jgi:hypothetical protein
LVEVWVEVVVEVEVEVWVEVVVVVWVEVWVVVWVEVGVIHLLVNPMFYVAYCNAREGTFTDEIDEVTCEKCLEEMKRR